jgi:predicted RND superfamily exporter protein
MVIAAAPPLVAILLSLGALGWLDFRLNMFLNVMTPLIMVISFSDSMQLTFAARDRLMAGESKYDAFRNAVLVVGPACVLTHVTAGLSFVALRFSDSELIQSFGEAGLIATLIALLTVLMLLPVLGVLLVRSNASLAAARTPRNDTPVNALRHFCGWIARRMVNRPGLYSLIGLLVVALLGVVYANLQPRYRLADQVPDREQAVSASGSLDAKLTGANPIDVLIEFPAGANLYDPGTLAIIAAVHTTLETQAGVGNVWSVETLRRWLAERAGRTDTATLREYVEMLPEHLTRRFVAADADAVVVTGRIPDIDSSQLLPVVNRLDTALETVRSAHPGYTVSVTGLAAIAARNSAAMIGKLNRGLTIEIVFVAAFIGLAFRSALVMVASILPAIFPIVASGGLLWLLGEGLQFASVVALTVSVRTWAQRHDPLPQPSSAGGSPGRKLRRGGGEGDDSGRPGADPDFARAGLRVGRDGVFRSAVVAVVRLAERLLHDRCAGCRPPDPAPDNHVPAQPYKARRQGPGAGRSLIRAQRVCTTAG